MYGFAVKSIPLPRPTAIKKNLTEWHIPTSHFAYLLSLISRDPFTPSYRQAFGMTTCLVA